LKKTTLVILAAGMGSRYGALKQIDPVGPNGEFILDYSVFDAKRAGFDKVVFIIKKAIEEEFKKAIGSRFEKHIEVGYAYQELDKLPKGYSVPEIRQKPWGTGHAVMCCKDAVDTPFAVINADDYYGCDAFAKIYDFLVSENKSETLDFCMAGFALKNTLAESGSVSRGVCTVTSENFLSDIVERVQIEKHGETIEFTEDNSTWSALSPETVVSMNCWGFPAQFLDCIEEKFAEFLAGIKDNPEKAEFYLPNCVDSLIKEKTASVKVLNTSDKWYGITYKEDKDALMSALKMMTDKGKYPERLWK